ncbi:hypothetical protein DMB95_08955 [Campylobacter sp. MIT 12-8780]|uniref:DUF5131 family protein n=1 Tax=unclassified Campylobacter TaxID=2593542 RepID=UPI00115C9CC7|nr:MULTISPECIES: DUF5131 family protein [unclassified Campylobacter]NDJ27919.1 DUF5131 family protein [Campylobacter sp. MIT 19-121]TQR40148.1 hypothetical protein DMB95_08955 [Campylobacter sp. MIT 12-8780]
MSKIEWCDKTFNCITGCSGISEACKNCYARSMHKRLHAMYLKNPSQKSVQKYSQPFDKVIFHEESLKELEDTKKYPSGSKIFVNSMSDTFHKDVKEEWINSIFSAIRKRKDCDFLFLTKRVGWMINRLWLGLHALPDNALFGVTIENQEQLDLRFENLAGLKQVRDLNKNTRFFISCEPLLSELDFGKDLKYIDWVIVGGESVPNAPKKARTMKAEWVQKLYEDCKKAGVPFFFKQWGNAPRDESKTYAFEACKEFYR